MPPPVELKVKPSVVRIGGTARTDNDTMKTLMMNDGELAVISSEKKDILVNLFADSLIESGCIKLREGDMKKLSVNSGDMVRVRAHENLLSKGLIDKLL
ncbi:MAG: hypothetical protein R6U17_03640 [Thermoplasmata archaeon]